MPVSSGNMPSKAVRLTTAAFVAYMLAFPVHAFADGAGSGDTAVSVAIEYVVEGDGEFIEYGSLEGPASRQADVPDGGDVLPKTGDLMGALAWVSAAAGSLAITLISSCRVRSRRLAVGENGRES